MPDPRLSQRARIGILAVVVSLASGAVGLGWWRTHNLGPVERGWRLVSRHGCLSCHGAAGRPEDPHPAGTGGAPSFAHEDVTDYARDESELREWILDGRPRRLREEEGDARRPLLAMPAFRGVLSNREVDHVVAWIVAVSAFEPVTGEAAEGRELASRLGCFGCHGPGGRGGTPNPGSLKGYIPSWGGADYAELVLDEGELREWIRDGSPRRLRGTPVATFFLDRQLIRMPGFGGEITDAEIRQIGAYIRWLRHRPTGPSSGS
jgi:mono/diheme cytochrome c family protein